MVEVQCVQRCRVRCLHAYYGPNFVEVGMVNGVKELQNGGSTHTKNSCMLLALSSNTIDDITQHHCEHPLRATEMIK